MAFSFPSETAAPILLAAPSVAMIGDRANRADADVADADAGVRLLARQGDDDSTAAAADIVWATLRGEPDARLAAQIETLASDGIGPRAGRRRRPGRIAATGVIVARARAAR